MMRWWGVPGTDGKSVYCEFNRGCDRMRALAAWTVTPQARGEEGAKKINALICELKDELKFVSGILETEIDTFT